MSLATQKKGTIRRSKSSPAAAEAGANRSISAMSICVEETRLVGARNLRRGLFRSKRKLTNEGLLPICR